MMGRRINATRPAGYRDRGFSLIEVLVTILILMVGLLGLAGLQGRALTAQMESYQRSQALILLKDMADRINANRKNAADYVTAGLGTGAACPAAVAGNIASADLNEWCEALLGAAETQGGASVGAMIGARGCVYEITPLAAGVMGEYLIAVAWQGLNSTAVPAVDCGEGAYGNEAKRRVVTLPISIASLI